MRNAKGQFIKGVYVGFGFKKGLKPWNKDKKGIHLSPKSEFKKGMTPWNKGKSGARGKSIANWKGDDVGYAGLHDWVERWAGKAKKCENRLKKSLPFNCTKKSKKYEWANKSGEYKRDLSDYIALCKSCHTKHDIFFKIWGKATKAFNL